MPCAASEIDGPSPTALNARTLYVPFAFAAGPGTVRLRTFAPTVWVPAGPSTRYPVIAAPFPFEAGMVQLSDAPLSPTTTCSRLGALGARAAAMGWTSSQPGTARHTSSRPPVSTLPDSHGLVTTAWTRRVRNAPTFRAGSAVTARTAAPLTIGAAIDVPSSEQYR